MEVETADQSYVQRHFSHFGGYKATINYLPIVSFKVYTGYG